MSDTTFIVLDATAASVTLSASQDAGNSSYLVLKKNLIDPVSGVDHLIREDGSAYVSATGKRAAYKACIAKATPLATPTAIFTIQGSATKKVAITRISVTGGATAAGSMQLSLHKRSTAGTDNTSTTRSHLTKVKFESSDGSATAVVDLIQGANQDTPGTTVGRIGARRLNLPAIDSVATSGEGKPEVWEFGAIRGAKPLVLVSDSEWLTVDGEGSALPSGTKIDFEIEWSEY